MKVSEQSKLKEAKDIVKLFSVDIVIKMFGYTIWEYHFPPQNS